MRIHPVFKPVFDLVYTLLAKLKQRRTALMLTFVLIFLTGVYGFYHFEGRAQNLSLLDAIYWAVITMSTIGYGDISPHTPQGKIFTSIFAVVGISAFAVVATNIFEVVVAENMKKILGLGRCNWSDHLIVVGWNETARNAVKYLIESYNARLVVISDENPDIEKRDSLFYINGRNITEEVLEKANVKKARFAIVCPKDDVTAIMATLLIKRLNPNINIVAEAVSMEKAPLIQQAGAYVINTTEFAGRILASFVYEPYVTMFFEVLTTAYKDNNLEELEILPDLVGCSYWKAVKHLRARYGMALVGVRYDDEYIINPPEDYILDSGHRLIVITSSRGRKKYLSDL